MNYFLFSSFKPYSLFLFCSVAVGRITRTPMRKNSFGFLFSDFLSVASSRWIYLQHKVQNSLLPLLHCVFYCLLISANLSIGKNSKPFGISCCLCLPDTNGRKIPILRLSPAQTSLTPTFYFNSARLLSDFFSVSLLPVGCLFYFNNKKQLGKRPHFLFSSPAFSRCYW